MKNVSRPERLEVIPAWSESLVRHSSANHQDLNSISIHGKRFSMRLGKRYLEFDYLVLNSIF